MITWLKAKVNPIPTQYDCLMLLSTGDVVMGRYKTGMMVVGWSIVNRPDWLFKVKSSGHATGEDHPKSRLSDADCELIRELYTEPHKGLSYSEIALKFDCSKSTIRDIIKGRTR